MKKPIMNVFGLALVIMILSAIAVTSNWMGGSNDEKISSLDNENEYNVTSICDRINRLSESVMKPVQEVKSSIDACDRRGNYYYDESYPKKRYADYGNNYIDENSDDYKTDYPDENVKKLDNNIVDNYEEVPDVIE